VTKSLGIYHHSRAKEEEEKEGKNPREMRCEDWMRVLTHSWLCPVYFFLLTVFNFRVLTPKCYLFTYQAKKTKLPFERLYINAPKHYL